MITGLYLRKKVNVIGELNPNSFSWWSQPRCRAHGAVCCLHWGVGLHWGERIQSVFHSTWPLEVSQGPGLNTELSGLERHLRLWGFFGVWGRPVGERSFQEHVWNDPNSPILELLSPWLPRKGVSKIWALGTNLACCLHMFKIYWNTAILTSLHFICGWFWDITAE